MLLFPNRYWNRVTMETSRSIKSYLQWLALWMLMLHALSTIALIGANYGYHYQNNASLNLSMSRLTPGQQRQYEYMLTDLTTAEYWVPIVGESFFFPIIQRANFTQDFAMAFAYLGTGCLGISIMWFILFSAFPVTRKRTKLRMIHVTRAMIVAGFLPMLGIQIGRLFEAIVFAGYYWSPISQFADVGVPIAASALILMTVIWLQWFWIAATRIGWQVKAKWWELVLVVIAAFLGVPMSGFIMIAFKPVRAAVDHFATFLGI